MSKQTDFFSASNYRSALSRAIYADNNSLDNDKSMKRKMKGIQKFYDSQFKCFCFIKKLDPINELCIRLIELEDDEMRNPVSLFAGIFIGFVSSISMDFFTKAFNNENLFAAPTLVSIGMVTLTIGTFATHYFHYGAKTLKPRRRILKEFEHKIVTNYLNDYLDEIRKEIEST